VAVPLAGRATDERSRVKCLVPARGARRGMVLDEGSAAIPRDAVARNAAISCAAGICTNLLNAIACDFLQLSLPEHSALHQASLRC